MQPTTESRVANRPARGPLGALSSFFDFRTGSESARARGSIRSALGWPLWVLVALVVAAVVGWVLSARGGGGSLAVSLQPPSLSHPFGTDLQGRDLLARTLAGLALSLGIGVLATCVATLLGTAVGTAAGFCGGRLDQALMRTVDVLYGLPYVAFVAVLIVVFGRGAGNLFLAIGAMSWLTTARILRGEVRRVRSLAYVDAARALGAGAGRLVHAHVLPNVLSTILVYGAITVPAAIRQEALLSFLGLGVAPPQASLGSLLREGMAALSPVQHTWWLLAFPTATMVGLVWALHALADRLRDRLDPRRR